MKKKKLFIILAFSLDFSLLCGGEKEEDLWHKEYNSFYFGFHSDELRRYYSDSLTPLGRTEHNIAELIESLKNLFSYFLNVNKESNHDSVPLVHRKKS